MSLEMDHLERLNRHTVSIEKSISHTLHEIERLQARRSGVPVLPPVSLDVNLHSEGPDGSQSHSMPVSSTIELESNPGVTSGATGADISKGDGELPESPASEETSQPEPDSVSSEICGTKPTISPENEPCGAPTSTPESQSESAESPDPPQADADNPSLANGETNPTDPSIKNESPGTSTPAVPIGLQVTQEAIHIHVRPCYAAS